MSKFPSITALDGLLAGLGVGEARQRQLGMVRGELDRALALDDFGQARRSLAALLDDAVLRRYFVVSESGELRERLVRGGKPPTSEATNQARRDCVDLLLLAAERPRLQATARPWGREPDTRPAVVLRSTPEAGELAALRRRLSDALATPLDPGRARYTAMVGMVLDTAARAGELVGQQLGDLQEDLVDVDVRRWPQHGTSATADADPEVLPLSPLTTAALGQWLPARERLTAHLQGAATALWVSLRANHVGLLDDHGRATMRPPGLPLEERGFARAYAAGRRRYGLADLLPPKMEQLRRAVAARLQVP